MKCSDQCLTDRLSQRDGPFRLAKVLTGGMMSKDIVRYQFMTFCLYPTGNEKSQKVCELRNDLFFFSKMRRKKTCWKEGQALERNTRLLL